MLFNGMIRIATMFYTVRSVGQMCVSAQAVFRTLHSMSGRTRNISRRLWRSTQPLPKQRLWAFQNCQKRRNRRPSCSSFPKLPIYQQNPLCLPSPGHLCCLTRPRQTSANLQHPRLNRPARSTLTASSRHHQHCNPWLMQLLRTQLPHRRTQSWRSFAHFHILSQPPSPSAHLATFLHALTAIRDTGFNLAKICGRISWIPSLTTPSAMASKHRKLPQRFDEGSGGWMDSAGG